jgi:hypothetical protein
MVGGAVVEVPTMICCGGVSGALELGRALASSSLRLKMELQLSSGLCKHGCMKLDVPFIAFIVHVLHGFGVVVLVRGSVCWGDGPSDECRKVEVF